MENNRNVILFIAMSLDGFIAKPDGDIEFLKLVEHDDEDYGYNAFLNTIDTIILGRKTYEKVLSLGFDYANLDKETFVITRTARVPKGNVQFYTGTVPELINQLRSQTGKNIFVDGGAETVTEFLKHQLIDELYISVIPVMLGSGIRLFSQGLPQQNLKLVSTKQFEKGLVQLHYARISQL